MDKTLNIDGKKIVYQVTGSGSPVMLVHGFGETSQVWASQASELSRKFQIILVDLPGSGQSGQVEDMSMEGMAAVLKKIWDVYFKENVSNNPVKPIMIGHSMGGYVTLAFAEKFAGFLSGLGLFHSTAFEDTEEKKQSRRKAIDFMKHHGGFEFLKTSTPNLFSGLTKEKNPRLIDDFILTLDGFAGEPLIRYYEAMIARPDRTEVLRTTDAAILFVAGQHDPAVPLADILQQSYLARKTYLHIFQDSAHMGMMEEKEKANKTLDEFLTSVSNDWQ